MRFTRTESGRRRCIFIEHRADWEVFERLVSAVTQTFAAEAGQPMYDVDMYAVSLNVAHAGVIVEVDHYQGVSVYAGSEQDDDEGFFLDVVNYLGAHAAELGIEIERKV